MERMLREEPTKGQDISLKPHTDRFPKETKFRAEIWLFKMNGQKKRTLAILMRMRRLT